VSPGDRAFVLLQGLVPQVLLTRFAGFMANRRARWLRQFLIRRFIATYDVAMDEAANPDPDAYGSFNEFFTRRLRADARPLPADPGAVVSPCDGTLSAYGPLDGSRLIQAKGVPYRAEDLLGEPSLADCFRDGSFATVYLSPRDYHRVHMPADGVLERMIYLPGGLFSVNPATVRARKGLFNRNERLVCVFRSPTLGRFAMVLVGAMIVGGIRTSWAGRITPRSSEGWRITAEARVRIGRGEEMGLFELGSTVILLFEGGRVGWDPQLESGARLRMGAAVARTLEPRREQDDPRVSSGDR